LPVCGTVAHASAAQAIPSIAEDEQSKPKRRKLLGDALNARECFNRGFNRELFEGAFPDSSRIKRSRYAFADTVSQTM